MARERTEGSDLQAKKEAGDQPVEGGWCGWWQSFRMASRREVVDFHRVKHARAVKLFVGVSACWSSTINACFGVQETLVRDSLCRDALLLG